MNLELQKEKLFWLRGLLKNQTAHNWGKISEILTLVKSSEKAFNFFDIEQYINTGTAFLTFDYGIDGVSIEISKYAKSLEQIYLPIGDCVIHLIGGDFYPQADNVLKHEWQRFRIEGINGWSKWNEGKWFSKLYKQQMPDGSPISSHLAEEIFRQAVYIVERLGKYMVENQIFLLIPVNVASNPGNLSLSLALVLVTEAMGTYVINSNHDFYWEGGKPASERKPGEAPGVRDHFFRNVDNIPFFNLLKTLYPWNGERWLQVNINRLQSRTLIDKFGFSIAQVFKLTTSVGDKFFAPYDRKDVIYSRLRMAHILSDGQPILNPIPIDDHLIKLREWMANQTPITLGARQGLSVDPRNEGLLILLQPTRVIARKRIEKDMELIGSLLTNSELKSVFEKDSKRQLLLHISGPTPREHQADLERILNAYKDTLAALPDFLANRIFLSFSVGNENHPSFKENGFKPLNIESIYQMADAVLLPSQTEGRGLPIIESSARGIPIICSRYQPHEVFKGVVGENLSEDLRINCIIFPEGKLDQDFLNEVADILIKKGKYEDRWTLNQAAARKRYSQQVLKRSFENFLRRFRRMRC